MVLLVKAGMEIGKNSETFVWYQVTRVFFGRRWRRADTVSTSHNTPETFLLIVIVTRIGRKNIRKNNLKIIKEKLKFLKISSGYLLVMITWSLDGITWRQAFVTWIKLATNRNETTAKETATTNTLLLTRLCMRIYFFLF